MALINNSIEYLEISLKRRLLRCKLLVEDTPYEIGFNGPESFRQALLDLIVEEGLVLMPCSNVIFLADGASYGSIFRYGEILREVLERPKGRYGA